MLAGVAAAPGAVWQELWAAVDVLLAEDSWVEWERSTTGADGVIRLGYPVYSDAVTRVHRLLGQVGAIVPFDWPTWSGWDRYPDGVGLDDAPAADAVRMLTSVIRAERFG